MAKIILNGDPVKLKFLEDVEFNGVIVIIPKNKNPACCHILTRCNMGKLTQYGFTPLFRDKHSGGLVYSSSLFFDASIKKALDAGEEVHQMKIEEFSEYLKSTLWK